MWTFSWERLPKALAQQEGILLDLRYISNFNCKLYLTWKSLFWWGGGTQPIRLLLLFKLVVWGNVCELRPPVGLLFYPYRQCMSMENHGRMIITGETEELGEKSVPLPLYPHQVPHGLTWAWTWASAVRGQWPPLPWHSHPLNWKDRLCVWDWCLFTLKENLSANETC
jgi:hypothetical protein